MTTALSPVGPDSYRALMAAHPGGVAVVTTDDGLGTPYGFACTAWCGVSLDPPLLLVCASTTGSTLPVLAGRGWFAVNLLHGAGRRAAEAFAHRDAGRFSAVPWQRSPATGLPLLPEDAHTVAECRVHRLNPAGDHTVIIGGIVRTTTTRGADQPPLLYGMRRYATWPAP
ncbi:flavin reductase family protein [Streptomyces rectiverticillatus]|uniref:flavin reductase family protein n=1 Tax=Streptomyces rectiverticillatus TaxID=173860 RepID=UPI0015C3B7C0|nr:flavin reductase family protein [Streptomyces rectiverticillatus]QLE74662.1 flavin reductase family protein [Streptomyces rectiverticillatus]